MSDTPSLPTTPSKPPSVLLVLPLIVVWSVLMALLPRSGGYGNPSTIAIGSLRHINSAQASYSMSCADEGYAVDLADLVKPRRGDAQGFLIPDLPSNGVIRSGYVIRLVKNGAPNVRDVSSPASTCNGSSGQPVSSYLARADPIDPGRWRPYFATDERGTIFESRRPIPNPIPAGAHAYGEPAAFDLATDWPDLLELPTFLAILAVDCAVVFILRPHRDAGRALLAFLLAGAAAVQVLPPMDASRSQYDFLHSGLLLVLAMALAVVLFIRVVAAAVDVVGRKTSR